MTLTKLWNGHAHVKWNLTPKSAAYKNLEQAKISWREST